VRGASELNKNRGRRKREKRQNGGAIVHLTIEECSWHKAIRRGDADKSKTKRGRMDRGGKTGRKQHSRTVGTFKDKGVNSGGEPNFYKPVSGRGSPACQAETGEKVVK